MRKKLSQVDLLQNYRNWRQGTGVFECFLRATPFVSLRHYPDMELDLSPPELPEEDRKLIALVEKRLNLETLLVADLAAERAAGWAYYLQKALGRKPVLVFNNPLHPKGLVGNEDFIRVLLAGGEHLETVSEAVGYAFILDYSRYGDFSPEEFREFFNNQYELSDEDLPHRDLLNFCGINRLVVVSGQPIKEDLAYYLQYIENQGLEVLMVNPQEGEDIDGR
ncbi:MAG: hypothetical protein M0Z31_10220 [Clostridia bacterium]|nr:hypothetical protein [Clostridia bacterium]